MPMNSYLTRRGFLAAGAGSIFLPWQACAQNGPVVLQDETGQPMHIRAKFAQHEFTATLYNTPTARDLVSLLPLDLKIEDYASNEKIAYLPRKLTTDDSGSFDNERPGDLCYYAPWGNLVFFYGAYRYSHGLIRIGRLDDGIAPLLSRGEFPLHLSLDTHHAG